MKDPDLLVETLKITLDNIKAYKESIKTHDDSEVSGKELIEKMILDGERIFTDAASKQKVQRGATYWYLLGKLYNCSAKFIHKAIDALKTATEIDPNAVDALNELGETYWNNLEGELAKECFEKALQKSENKLSLRNMSVVIRKQSLTMGRRDKSDSLKKALDFAKRALDLDLTDGQSWSTLGNSYLATFFVSPLEKKHILQAIACYSQAEKNHTGGDGCDIFYNKAVALKYIEKYSGALDYMLKCVEGDNSWDLPPKEYARLIQYLELIKNNLGHKGKMKPKRYYSMLKDTVSLQSGPYAGPQYRQSSVSDLKKGSDQTSVLCARLLWYVEVDDTFPVTLGLVDANGDEIVTTIFNLKNAQNFFKIGDSVAIPNPQYEDVEVSHKGKEYRFSKVRVDNPTALTVNNMFIPKFFYGSYNFDTSTI